MPGHGAAHGPRDSKARPARRDRRADFEAWLSERTIDPAVAGSGVEDWIPWARESPENERVFWSSIFPKLLPVQVTGKDEGPLQISSRVVILPEKRVAKISVWPLRPEEARG